VCNVVKSTQRTLIAKEWFAAEISDLMGRSIRKGLAAILGFAGTSSLEFPA